MTGFSFFFPERLSKRELQDPCFEVDKEDLIFSQCGITFLFRYQFLFMTPYFGKGSDTLQILFK